jgi:hypothetical protein
MLLIVGFLACQILGIVGSQIENKLKYLLFKKDVICNLTTLKS